VGKGKRIPIIAEKGSRPKSVIGQKALMGDGKGGEIKRGPKPPFSLLWRRKLIGRYVFWFGRRNIVDRHL